LLSEENPIVVDEFSSVVDRQVAKIVSNSVQKYVRKNNRRFVAVSCHYDIIDWLQPDWVFEPHTGRFTRRSLQRRPEVEAVVSPIPHAAWRVFAPFHYMSNELHKAARCHGLFVNDELVGFAGVLYRPLSTKVKYEIYGLSRLVVLPDWQGLGLAFHLMNKLGSIYSSLGHKFHTYPAHPSFVRSMNRDKANWLCVESGSKRFGTKIGKKSSMNWLLASTDGLVRQCSVFRYVGSKLEKSVTEEYMSFWKTKKMIS
jgi:GNAT superfamily N-acetyltransferase